MKALFALFSLLLFAHQIFAQDELVQNLDSAEFVVMAKSVCEGKTKGFSAEQQRDFCVQYHDYMADHYRSITMLHEACTKAPDLAICKRDKSTARID